MHSTHDTVPKAEISDFAKRVQMRRKQLNFSKQMLATAIGVSLTTIQLYESNQLPKAKFAVKLAKALKCSLDWLLVGSEYIDENKVATNGSRFMPVPMAEASLSEEGHVLKIDANIEDIYSFGLDFLELLGKPETMLLYKAIGDSMFPKIMHNDIVLIDTSLRKPIPEGIFAIEIEGMVYLKITNAVPGKLILSSLNNNYTPIEIDLKDDADKKLHIIGRVLWVGRVLV